MIVDGERAKDLARRVAPRPLFRLGFAAMHPGNRGHRMAAVCRSLRYEIGTRLLHRPLVVPLGERSSMIVYPEETNAPKVVSTKRPNWREMTVWHGILRAGDLFVDVGGNIGSYTVFAQDLGAKTITMEPDRRNVERIRENLRLNGYEGEVLNVAAADKAGTLRITEGLDSLNHLVLHGEGGVEVRAVTLDEVLGDRYVTGLKIDVEGAERLVLEGAAEALARGRIRIIQCEWSGHEVERTLGETRQQVEELLRRYGYRFYRPDKDGRLQGPLETPIPVGRDVFALLDPV